MEKISLWKRMGGWLRRSHMPRADEEMVQLDAEGLIIDNNNNSDASLSDTASIEDGDNTKPANGNLSAMLPRNKKEQQLAAMEEGFNRLVTVMEAINENMIQQQQETRKLNAHLENIPDLLRKIPQTVESQTQSTQAMTDELKKQSLQQQQLNEIIRTLPELTQAQLDKLGSITTNLESSLENELRIAESFSRLDGSMQTVADSAQAQATSLTHIGKMLEQNEQKIQQMLHKQNNRFIWLAITVIIAALAAIAVILYKMFGVSVST